ncbi:unnamed protein product, partial [Mesorhabditis spiculigera]
MDEEDEYYEIKKIIKRKMRNGMVFFFVEWKGCGPEKNSWIPEEACRGHESAVEFIARNSKVYSCEEELISEKYPKVAAHISQGIEPPLAVPCCASSIPGIAESVATSEAATVRSDDPTPVVSDAESDTGPLLPPPTPPILTAPVAVVENVNREDLDPRLRRRSPSSDSGPNSVDSVAASAGSLDSTNTASELLAQPPIPPVLPPPGKTSLPTQPNPPFSTPFQVEPQFSPPPSLPFESRPQFHPPSPLPFQSRPLFYPPSPHSEQPPIRDDNQHQGFSPRLDLSIPIETNIEIADPRLRNTSSSSTVVPRPPIQSVARQAAQHLPAGIASDPASGVDRHAEAVRQSNVADRRSAGPAPIKPREPVAGSSRASNREPGVEDFSENRNLNPAHDTLNSSTDSADRPSTSHAADMDYEEPDADYDAEYIDPSRPAPRIAHSRKSDDSAPPARIQLELRRQTAPAPVGKSAGPPRSHAASLAKQAPAIPRSKPTIRTTHQPRYSVDQFESNGVYKLGQKAVKKPMAAENRPAPPPPPVRPVPRLPDKPPPPDKAKALQLNKPKAVAMKDPLALSKSAAKRKPPPRSDHTRIRPERVPQKGTTLVSPNKINRQSTSDMLAEVASKSPDKRADQARPRPSAPVDVSKPGTSQSSAPIFTKRIPPAIPRKRPEPQNDLQKKNIAPRNLGERSVSRDTSISTERDRSLDTDRSNSLPKKKKKKDRPSNSPIRSETEMHKKNKVKTVVADSRSEKIHSSSEDSDIEPRICPQKLIPASDSDDAFEENLEQSTSSKTINQIDKPSPPHPAEGDSISDGELDSDEVLAKTSRKSRHMEAKRLEERQQQQEKKEERDRKKKEKQAKRKQQIEERQAKEDAARIKRLEAEEERLRAEEPIDLLDMGDIPSENVVENDQLYDPRAAPPRPSEEGPERSHAAEPGFLKHCIQIKEIIHLLEYEGVKCAVATYPDTTACRLIPLEMLKIGNPAAYLRALRLT